MIILGVETSCDETSAAVLEQKNGRIQILSNVVSSSLELHAKYGGIIPEQAAREQLKIIIPVITEALEKADIQPGEIDKLAVTEGPGLIGSLLVGVETMKVLAKIWNKPLIPVNHLIGHFYANWIGEDQPKFPAIGLLVSGGHTDLVFFKDHHQYEYLGGTRDDAAGECFDKCARILGYNYPGGPKISSLANSGNPTFDLPKPMVDSKDFDFSFSGLKTAFLNTVKENFDLDKGHFNKEGHLWEQKSADQQLSEVELQKVQDVCASLQNVIVDVIVKKTLVAVQKYNVEQLIVAGGVAANKKLTEELSIGLDKHSKKVKLSVPPPILCTDNGAMITSAAFYLEPIENPEILQANPNLSLAY